MSDTVLWSSAKKKPEPQLYESIQLKTFFDINEKTNEKQQRILLFQSGKKVKKEAECPRNQINSLEKNLNTHKNKREQFEKNNKQFNH